jgi:hypothetical protein
VKLAFGWRSAISRSSDSRVSIAITGTPVAISSSITLRPVEPAPHTITWSFIFFIRFLSLFANSAFLRSPSMMNAVIVEAKNTIVPVPNRSKMIVKPRAYSTVSIPFRTSP